MATAQEVFSLTVLLYRDEDCPGQFVAHCLEFDIVAVAPTKPKAVALLKELVEDAAVAAHEDGTEGELFNPAPSAYWRKLAHARPYPPPRGLAPFAPAGPGGEASQLRRSAVGRLAVARPRVIKFRRFRKLLARYGVTVRPGGRHSLLVSHDGRFKYPVPFSRASDDVFRPYVDGARRRFHLTPEDGISDDEFYSL